MESIVFFLNFGLAEAIFEMRRNTLRDFIDSVDTDADLGYRGLFYLGISGDESRLELQGCRIPPL